MFSFLALAAVFVAPSLVNAHGFVHSLEVGGKNYSGWLPFTDPYESPVPKRIVRQIPDDGPVLDVTSPDIACNRGGESPAGAIATAPAGSKITFDWLKWPSDHMGPVDTYMASCKGSCSAFDTSGAKWFKIDAAGYSNGKWAATRLIENGFKWTSTIPAELADGEYLVRHQIVALHSAGQPQFYPSCAQVKVTGGGGKVPSGSQLVSIPGLYNNVQWPDIWSASFKFTIPGPSVVFSGSNSDPSSNDGSKDPAPSSSSARPATSSLASTSRSASSTKVSKPTSTSSPDEPPATSSPTSSAPASKGRCSAKRRRGMVKRRRGMVKRRVSHHAKRHH